MHIDYRPLSLQAFEMLVRLAKASPGVRQWLAANRSSLEWVSEWPKFRHLFVEGRAPAMDLVDVAQCVPMPRLASARVKRAPALY